MCHTIGKGGIGKNLLNDGRMFVGDWEGLFINPVFFQGLKREGIPYNMHATMGLVVAVFPLDVVEVETVSHRLKLKFYKFHFYHMRSFLGYKQKKSGFARIFLKKEVACASIYRK